MGGGCICVISSGMKVAKGGRSRSRVSPWNRAVNFSNNTFVVEQWHMMWMSSVRTVMSVAT